MAAPILTELITNRSQDTSEGRVEPQVGSQGRRQSHRSDHSYRDRDDVTEMRSDHKDARPLVGRGGRQNQKSNFEAAWGRFSCGGHFKEPHSVYMIILGHLLFLDRDFMKSTFGPYGISHPC